jgi:DNA invertase Pin-like site-specific DNA recombinase
MKSIAIYCRVSTSTQDTKSQEPDLKRWANAQDSPVKWYRDKASGKSMDRPAWSKLEAAIRQGRVSSIVCWRLDRLGCTAAGLTGLFAELQDRKVNLVSMKEGLDLATPSGRLLAHVLASVAQFETELRAERVLAGQAVAKANGKKWGGSSPGVPKKLASEKHRHKIELIHQMKASGKPIAVIARTLELSRPTIYSVLARKVV